MLACLKILVRRSTRLDEPVARQAAYLFFVRVWDGENEVALYHVRMFPSAVGTIESKFLEFPDKMGPRDRGKFSH